jgi:hypothetical protein
LNGKSGIRSRFCKDESGNHQHIAELAVDILLMEADPGFDRLLATDGIMVSCQQVVQVGFGQRNQGYQN